MSPFKIELYALFVGMAHFVEIWLIQLIVCLSVYQPHPGPQKILLLL